MSERKDLAAKARHYDECEALAEHYVKLAKVREAFSQGHKVVWVYGPAVATALADGEASDTLFATPEGLSYENMMIPLCTGIFEPQDWDGRMKAAGAEQEAVLNDIAAAHCHACAPCDYEGIRVAAIWALREIDRLRRAAHQGETP